MTKPTLQELLDSLHSDDARVKFLQSAYRTGRSDIADALFALQPEHHEILEVLVAEIKYANTHGPIERFRNLAKRDVDADIANNDYDEIVWTLGQWDNKEVSLYVAQELEKQSKNLDALAISAQVYGKVNRVEDASRVRNLQIQLLRKQDDFDGLVEVLDVAKRHDDLIQELLSKGRSEDLERAFNTADDLDRLDLMKSIGDTIIDGYSESTDPVPLDFYWKCAERIGRKEEAKVVIEDLLSRADPGAESMRTYQPMLRAVHSSGLTQLGESFLQRASDHALTIPMDDGIDTQKLYDIKTLYNILGVTPPKELALRRKFATEVGCARTGETVRHQAIDAFGETSNPAYLQYALRAMEDHGWYAQAATLANVLEQTKLVEFYRTMADMVSVGKTSRRRLNKDVSQLPL